MRDGESESEFRLFEKGVGGREIERQGEGRDSWGPGSEFRSFKKPGRKTAGVMKYVLIPASSQSRQHYNFITQIV